MSFDQDRHHRRSIRLPDYDYSQPGSYFVTICTYQRLNLFADRPLRCVAEVAWQALPGFDPCLRIDAWVVMPNHVHGIIDIVERSSRAERPWDKSGRPIQAAGLGITVRPGTLGAIVRSYKAVVARTNLAAWLLGACYSR